MSHEDVRPPVEPMSDLSWARVERGLWSRLDGTQPSIEAAPRSRRWLWLAVPSLAGAAAIAAVFALFVDSPRSAVPRLAAPVAGDDTPTRIVSSDAPSTITLGDVHVTLDPSSAVVMPRHGSSAVLDRGAAWFSVDRPFVVMAGDTVVRVLGTRFRVARYEEHATVEVERGSVEIAFRGTTATLNAGQEWSSRPARSAEATPAPDTVTDEPDGARPTDRPAASTTVREPTRSRGAGAARPATISAASDEQAKYERARDIEATEADRAFAAYLEIARGKSAWAAMSLYAAGRLAADRGNAERARALLDAYLRRFPRGANADDARQLLDRLKGVP